MNARGLLEIAKATGEADIMPGYKLFTREYLKKGRIVDLDSTHRAEIAKDGAFHLGEWAVIYSYPPDGGLLNPPEVRP